MKNKYALLGVTAALIGAVFLLAGLKGLMEEHHAGEEYESLLDRMGTETAAVQNATMTEMSEIESERLSDSEANSETVETVVPESAVGESEAEESHDFVTREDIDFEVLQALNPDIYAWIEVPGTNIDYPIVQHEEDNSYYLTHTIEHKETVAASIYTENYNSKDFEDHHTVIYGHNMKNGTMFRSLHQFEDYDFFEEHREIIIYMPEDTKYYKIFAAYTYDNRHLLHSYYCEEAESFQKYLDEVFAIKDFDAFIDREIEVTGEDRIITLSTCVNSGDMTQRYLVQAVLID